MLRCSGRAQKEASGVSFGDWEAARVSDWEASRVNGTRLVSASVIERPWESCA